MAAVVYPQQSQTDSEQQEKTNGRVKMGKDSLVEIGC